MVEPGAFSRMCWALVFPLLSPARALTCTVHGTLNLVPYMSSRLVVHAVTSTTSRPARRGSSKPANELFAPAPPQSDSHHFYCTAFPYGETYQRV